MEHQLYSKEYIKTKKGAYPKVLVSTNPGPNRHDRRKAWAMAGAMTTDGKFYGGVVPKKYAGQFLMRRYLSGRPMSRFPSWFGWKEGEAGSDKYREKMVFLRSKSWKYDVRLKRNVAPSING